MQLDAIGRGQREKVREPPPGESRGPRDPWMGESMANDSAAQAARHAPSPARANRDITDLMHPDLRVSPSDKPQTAARVPFAHAAIGHAPSLAPSW